MGILSKLTGSMHNLTILLLLFFIVLSSLYLRQFPFSTLIAVGIVVAGDLIILKLHHKRMLKIPYSGIITGMIIGSVAPQNAPLRLIVLASIMALVAIFLIRTKRGNIFNPAAFGLLAALALFSTGDAWWASYPSLTLLGFTVPLTLLLVLATYEAKRLPTALGFVLAGALGGIIILGQISLGAFFASLFSINFYFAFIMLSEPKTSPHKRRGQVVYGAGVGLLFLTLASFGVQYPLLISLLLGNLGYMLYRQRG